jgi:segregation and condensation protein A
MSNPSEDGRVETGYQVQLEQYEGPLDLLLDLIRKQDLNIHDIPIARITGQYLAYLHQLEEHDLDISGDFLYMAATLIHIKSKMLLPQDPLAGPEEQLDPRADLVHRLLEHEQFKNAASMLQQKQQIEQHVWSRPDLSLYAGDREGEVVASLTDLVRVFSQVLERRRQVARIELKHEQFTVAQMMDRLRAELLAAAEGEVSLLAFFEACPSRHAMIVAFLALLEMVRMQAVLLTQKEAFGDVFVRKHKMFDAVFSGDGAVAKIDEEYL